MLASAGHAAAQTHIRPAHRHREIDHRGATGPMLFKTGFSIVYVGEEDISVAAGNFRGRHFQITDTAGNLPEEHPPYEVWCTADDDYILLKAGAGGYMQTHYELTDLIR